MLATTLTRDDDVAVLESNTGVGAGAEIGVAVITGESDELAGKPQAVPFGDPPGTADVLAGTLVFSFLYRLAGEFVEAVETLGCNTHSRSSVCIYE